MRRLVRASSAGALALASSLVLSLSGGSAQAVEVTGTGSTSVSLLSTTDATVQQVATEYWTPERMASAQPADRVVAPGGPAARPATPEAAPSPSSPSTRSTLAVGDAAVVGRSTRRASGTAPASTVATSTPWAGPAAVARKVGRLFFTQGRGNYECSASSVASVAGDVIVTAGHCLTENGVVSTNVVFVPGLHGTSAPYGTFPATKLFTTTQWRQGDQSKAEALNFDVGFAVVQSVGGRSLADTVGSFAIDFTPALDPVTVFGYPGRGAAADGTTLQFCTGTRFTDVTSTNDPTTDRATLCTMAGGSSGGPWLSGFDPAKGTGTVTSVVSFSYNDATEVLYGPLFGDVVAAVYHEAAGN
ncbi:trypsin-like serine peptidase [Kineococcus sp. GCM10028916]|uniref:trypsin-like serine peptidase n=1 Tax=Kineococcus sp. GCM10028916 TaxID=3273394 RepID=UPI00362965BC